MAFLSDRIICLRAVEPQDATAMWEMEQDSDQWIHNTMAAPFSFHNLKEYAENYDADPIRAGQLRLIIESVDSKNILGCIDLYDISPLHQTAFIGIYIKPEYRKSGMGRRAVYLLEKYAHNLLNLHQLGAKIMQPETASVRLFESCDYVLRGTLPEWYKVGKHRIDLLIYTKML